MTGSHSTDWVNWVLCDTHRLEHPLNPPGSPCLNPTPAPPAEPRPPKVNPR